jgi:hypothetical protein
MKRVLHLKSLLILLMIVLVSCSTRRSIAIEEGWELLAEQKVDFIRDKDEITVKNRTLFTAIKFRVEDKDVRLNDLKIYFDNGDKLEPSMDDVIPANKYSRVIELARDGRYINKIEFRYRTVGNIFSGRANVLVLGRKYYRPEY